MKRSVKITLVALGALIALPVLAFCALLAAGYLHAAGHWPFKPLERRDHDIALSNGGVMRIAAVEQRGFRSDGWTVHATYRAPNATELEAVGGWEGYQHHPAIYVVNELVVLRSPDQRTLYVRTTQGAWRFFVMQFPDDYASLPIAHYAVLSGLTEAEVTRIRREIASDRPGHSTAVSLDRFVPDSMEVHVTFFHTSPDTKGHLRLRLSDDGTRLTLIEVVKERPN